MTLSLGPYAPADCPGWERFSAAVLKLRILAL
jgi:hypothetical protein